jgi:hypothetical protein
MEDKKYGILENFIIDLLFLFFVFVFFSMLQIIEVDVHNKFFNPKLK